MAEPLTAEDLSPLYYVAQLMEPFSGPWGICGGWALSLFMGYRLREHEDVDVAVLRRDQLAVRRLWEADGFVPRVATGGGFRQWSPNEQLALPEHGIWFERSDGGFIELLLNESAGDRFLFRRNTTVAMPLQRAFVGTEAGVPILAPEIVLLYKAKDGYGAKNMSDFAAVAPCLEAEAKAWLRSALGRLYPAHPWQRALR